MSSRNHATEPSASLYRNHKGFNLYLQAQTSLLYHGHHDQDVAKGLGVNLSAVLSNLSREDGHTMIVAMFDTINATSTIAKAPSTTNTDDAHVLRGLLLIHYTANVDLAVKITEHLRTASYVVAKNKKDVSCKDFSSTLIPSSERIRNWFSVRPNQNSALPIAAAHYIAPPQHGARPASVLPFIKQLASQSSQLFEDTRCLFLTGSFMHSLIEKRFIVPPVIYPNYGVAAETMSSVAPVLPQRSKELKRKGSTGRSPSSAPAIVYATVDADIKREEIGLNLARIIPIEIIWLFGILEFLSESASRANGNKADLISMFNTLTSHGRPVNTVQSKGCSTFIMTELSSLAYSLVATYGDAQRLGATTKKSSAPVISQITKDTIFHTAPDGASHSLFAQRRFGAVKIAGYDCLDRAIPLSLNWGTQSAALMLFFGCNVSDISVDPSSPVIQNIPGAHRFLRTHLVELWSVIPNWFILLMLSALGMLTGKMTLRRSIAKKEMAKNNAASTTLREVAESSSSSSSNEEDDGNSSSSDGGSASSDEDFEDEVAIAAPRRQKRKRPSSEDADEKLVDIVESEESANLNSGAIGAKKKKNKLSSKSVKNNGITSPTTNEELGKKKERKKKSIFDNPRMAARKVSLPKTSTPPAVETPQKIEYILPPNAHWVSTTAVATATLPRVHDVVAARYQANGCSTEEDTEDQHHPSDKLLVPLTAEDHYNALRQSLLNESCSSSESSETDPNDPVLQKRLATRVSGEHIELLRSSMNLNRPIALLQPNDEDTENVVMDVRNGEVHNDDSENNGMLQLYEATYMDIEQAHSSFTDELLEQHFSEPSSPFHSQSQSQQNHFVEYPQFLPQPSSEAGVINNNTLQRQNGPPLNVTVGRVVELGFQNGIVEEDASLPRRQHSSSSHQHYQHSYQQSHENIDSDSTTATAQCDSIYDGVTEDEFDENGLRNSASLTSEDVCMAIDPFVISSTCNTVEETSPNDRAPYIPVITIESASTAPRVSLESSPSVLPAPDVKSLITTPPPSIVRGSVIQIKAMASSTPAKKLQFKKKIVV